jgi:hypothetical protein
MNEPSQSAPSFDADIKPLFREHDRTAMLRAFDLWSYGDVKAGAQEILARLKDGTMPCDGAWQAEDVAKFEDWIGRGVLP